MVCKYHKKLTGIILYLVAWRHSKLNYEEAWHVVVMYMCMCSDFWTAGSRQILLKMYLAWQARIYGQQSHEQSSKGPESLFTTATAFLMVHDPCTVCTSLIMTALFYWNCNQGWVLFFYQSRGGGFVCNSWQCACSCHGTCLFVCCQKVLCRLACLVVCVVRIEFAYKDSS